MPEIKSIILRIAIIIFIIEFFIMLLLSILGSDLPSEYEIIIDSIILTILSSLTIYFWIIKPYIMKNKVAEESLLKLHKELEKIMGLCHIECKEYNSKFSLPQIIKMNSTEIFSLALGLESPWEIKSVEMPEFHEKVDRVAKRRLFDNALCLGTTKTIRSNY